MACIKPFTIIIGENKDRVYSVPCGWCSACRRDKIDMWSIRCNNELLLNNFTGAYVTYTYDEDHIINCHGSLDLSIPKKITDRIRSTLNRKGDKRKFKYLISGEYGDEFVDKTYGVPIGRCHYHALFFGLDWHSDMKLLKDCWENSPQWNIKVLPISPGASYYVLKYVLKEIHGEEKEIVYGSRGLVPPFAHYSKGIGAQYYLDNKDFIKEHDGCTLVKGHLVPVPPYWLKKINVNCSKAVNLKPEFFEKSFAKYFNSLSIHEKRKLLKFGFYTSDRTNLELFQLYTEQSNKQKLLEDESKLKLYGRM